MDSLTPQWGELTSKEMRSSGCSWHGVGWAEAMLQIWTMEVLLSRTLLWGGECLVDEQQLLRRMIPHPSPPPIPPWSCDRKLSCFQIVWFRWLPHKQPIERSESSVWSGLFELTFWKCKTKTWNLPSIHNNGDVNAEAWVETVRDRPAWGFIALHCCTHYTVGQSEEGCHHDCLDFWLLFQLLGFMLTTGCNLTLQILSNGHNSCFLRPPEGKLFWSLKCNVT